jgi:hypothetical protein
VLYSIGQPTDEEQLYLEFINRARTNPPVEGVWLANLTDADVLAAYAGFGVDTNLLVSQFSSIAAAPPLSFNANLILASRGHSATCSPTCFKGTTARTAAIPAIASPQPATPGKPTAKTFTLLPNQSCTATLGSTWIGVLALAVCRRRPDIAPAFTIRASAKSASASSWETTAAWVRNLSLRDFGSRFNLSPIVTGVVYYDFNGNAFYDLGEGIGGVRVDINGVTAYALSANSGGYSVPVSGNGSQTVIFSFDGQTLTQRVATVSGSSNVKLDFVPPYAPPQISGPTSAAIGGNNNYSFNAVLGATNYQWRSATRVPSQPLKARRVERTMSRLFPVRATT